MNIVQNSIYESMTKEKTNENYSAEDINELALRYKEMPDEEKRNTEKFFCTNLTPMVLRILSKYARRTSPNYEDLKLEGIMSIIEAIRNYDPEYGAKFTSFVYSYVNNKIISASREIRYSGNSKQYNSRELSSYLKEKKNLTEELNRIPTIDELSIRTGKKKSTIIQLERLSNKPYSFDDLTSVSQDDDEDIAFIDTIPDTSETEWNHEIENNEFYEDLELYLSSIEDTDKKIISMYIGYGCSQKSFDEIALELNISKATAFRRFKKHSDNLAALLEI